MNVPLKWLAEYVKLPKETKVLTDKLTDVGHMLDKVSKVDGETIIDLELRGNRADMFGLIGVAREVAAVMNTNLKMPEVVSLPQIDANRPLVNVQPSAVGLVTRYTAVKLSVKVGPSPKWLATRLKLYGLPSINNVVDITNYVMLETGEPLHAFDFHKIKGRQLILRRAKQAEKFATITQGQTLNLSSEDLVICDQAGPQALTMIGGLDSRVTDSTSEIILEAAVYNQANCRRSARRLKVFTDSGTRHEKHLDPCQVALALQRAIYLLQHHATSKILGQTSDYYPHPVKSKIIKFDIAEVARLTGLTVPPTAITKILTSLEFKASGNAVTVPTFRTDIEGPADLVEEIGRIYGYAHIPATPIADPMPVPNSYPSYQLGEKLRDVCTNLGLDEVITLSLVEGGEVKLVNPPDPGFGYLRRDISPSLIKYAQQLLNLRQPQATIFEVGKTFSKSGAKYLEHLRLGIAMGGKSLTISNLTGVLQTAARLLGVDSLPAQAGAAGGIFWAEVDVDKLQHLLPAYANPYSVVSTFPPIIEDVNVTYSGNYQQLVNRIKKISSLISQIELVDKYADKLTLRITYHSTSKQLSSEDIAPIRKKLESIS